MTLTITLPLSIVTSLREMTEDAQIDRLEPVIRSAVKAALAVGMNLHQLDPESDDEFSVASSKTPVMA